MWTGVVVVKGRTAVWFLIKLSKPARGTRRNRTGASSIAQRRTMSETAVREKGLARLVVKVWAVMGEELPWGSDNTGGLCMQREAGYCGPIIFMGEPAVRH